LIGAVGIGEISMNSVPDLVKVVEVYEPDPVHRKLYDERFYAFKQLYRRNRRLYRRLNESRHTGNTA
jgi:hypothetical protein